MRRVRQKPGQLIVHLLNTRSANPLSPVAPHTEAVAPTGPVTIHVRLARKPRQVCAVPNDAEIAWKWSKGLLTIQLASLHIHAAIVLDS